MENTERYSSDVAFTPAVKAVQTRLGSRGTYARQELGGSWTDRVTPELAEFIAGQNSLFLATASADGQPYIQHRGGPPGFLRVLDEHTLAFADFRGNRQYITLGNLSENPKAQLFLMDYAHRQRIKIWGEARVVEDQPELLASLLVDGYKAKADRAIVFRVVAWDANCPQHIPQLVDVEAVQKVLRERDARIAELEARLKAAEAGKPSRPA
ncbi:pyridoxamine 5'-phosphate oxidase family protein [Nevskia soli]|uniref:pyridoxamine 5'-phosphate oxidase family protein n=1 Tax=Nevskia soli TaxID=418856 RepID=UPI0004A72674|nr:pyridoxamine 5'-phosphate oxidase family protein [Nevskia soli]